MENPTPKKEHSEFVPYQYPIKKKTFLKYGSLPFKKDFLDTLSQRISISKLSKPTDEDIYKLLEYCCKVRSFYIDDSGYIITKRTAPSAGARHPIDLLVSASQVNKLRILELYNPMDHSLNELNIPIDKLQKFYLEIDHNIDIQNAVLIWFSIQPLKTASKYLNPESLYWRDAGALLYCIQIISTYLGLSSCPVGTLAADSFNDIFGDELISGGGIIIGKSN